MYWGRAPPHRVTRTSAGAPRDPGRGGQVGSSQGNELAVVTLQDGFLADPADRAAHEDQPRRAVPQVRPLDRGERDRLHRPPVHRRDEVSTGLRELRERRVRVGQGDDGHARVADLAERRGGPGRAWHPAEQPAGRAGGQGEDDRVGVEVLGGVRRADGQPPAARPAGQLADHGPGPDLGARGGGQGGRQQAQAPVQRGEHGGPGPGLGGRGRQECGGRRGQRGMGAGRLGQAGQRRLEGQFLGPPGVHPAEQRVNQPVHDLLAEPGRHVALPPTRRRPGG